MATIVDTFIVKQGLESKDLTAKRGAATSQLKDLEKQRGKTSEEEASGVGALMCLFCVGFGLCWRYSVGFLVGSEGLEPPTSCL